MGRHRRRRDAPRQAASLAVGTSGVRREWPVRRRWLAWVAVAAAVGAGLYAAGAQVRRTAYEARLPALPDLSSQPPAVREHLGDADRVARDRPTSSEAVGALGIAYHADMFYGEADRAYAIAEALSNRAWRWTYYRALAQGTRGDAGGLITALRQVAAAAPEFGPAWWRLGEAEFKAGSYDRAAEAWRRALPLGEPRRAAVTSEPVRAPGAPLSAYAALGLARLSMVQRDADRARVLLENVTAESPGFGPAFRLLGDAYATLGRIEDGRRAIRIADRLPQYEPYADPLHETLIRESRSATFLLQQAATADLATNAGWREYLLRRAIEFDPDHVDALSELATMFRLLRRYDEALELLQRYRRLRPDDVRVLADVGRCLSGLRRFAEAEPVLRQALEGLDNAHTRYDLGLVLDRLGRVSEAVAEYRRALDRDPNHLNALNDLGLALASQGRLGEATRHFERLVAIDPEDAEAHMTLGLVLAAAGARERAARAFRETLRLDPDHEDARAGLREVESR